MLSVINVMEPPSIWIGSNDIATDGVWVWEDGKPWGVYTSWNSGEPNGGNNEQCVEMFKTKSGWNDGRCGDVRPFVCKKGITNVCYQFSIFFKSRSCDAMPCHAMPCHTTPYYTILYYTILYYTILYYTILYYTILYYTILYYTILYYTILYYTIPYYTTERLKHLYKSFGTQKEYFPYPQSEDLTWYR